MKAVPGLRASKRAFVLPIPLKQLRVIHKGKKKKSTKDYEAPRRGWRKLKRDPPKVGKGEKISTKGDKGSAKG